MTIGESLLLATKTQMYMDVVMVSKKCPITSKFVFQDCGKIFEKRKDTIS